MGRPYDVSSDPADLPNLDAPRSMPPAPHAGKRGGPRAQARPGKGAGCGVEGLFSEIDDDYVLRNRTPLAVAAGSLRIITGVRFVGLLSNAVRDSSFHPLADGYRMMARIVSCHLDVFPTADTPRTKGTNYAMTGCVAKEIVEVAATRETAGPT